MQGFNQTVIIMLLGVLIASSITIQPWTYIHI